LFEFLIKELTNEIIGGINQMKNYKVLFILRTLKELLAIFVDSFLVLYFVQVSQNNILPLGIYKLIAVISIYIVMFITKNFCKSKNRVIFLRIGIILDFIYFLTIILLKEKITDYIYFVGLLYGLEEGFYYCVANMFESDGITNEERTKYEGSYFSVQSILSIIFPIVFGSIIYTNGFLKSLPIVLFIVLFRLILSFLFKDTNIPKVSKINLKEFKNIVKKTPEVKKIYLINFFEGLTYSEGAFGYIVTIYIIKVFSNSFSLGIFTSIFSLVSCLLGILFAKVIKKKYYRKMIGVSMTFTIISLCIMLYKCNFITIVIFNFFQTVSKNLMNLINNTSGANISNLELIRKNYKVEYFFGMETCLIIARIISNSLFIIMAFSNISVLMFVFIGILIFYAYHSIQLQKIIEQKKSPSLS